MSPPSIQRSTSMKLPVTAGLDGTGPSEAIKAPQRLSQAASAVPAGTLAMHASDLQSLLTERLNTVPPAAANEEVTGRHGIELDPEEVHAALQQSQASQGAQPFSVSDALDFRSMMSQAGQATATQLMERLWEKHVVSHDSVVQQRLTQAMTELQAFKAQLAADAPKVGEQAMSLQAKPAASAAEQLAHIESLMGGRIKEPNSLKNLWKFSFSDNARAKSQLKGIERAAKQGQTFAPPGPPVHLQAAMTAHLKGLLKRAGLDDKAQIKTVKGELAQQMAAHNERAQGWQAIHNTISLTNKMGQQERFDNRITPAREFSAQVAATYTDGQKGVSCMSNTNATQTVNLWKTEFQAEGGGVKFSALRHGIHDAYKIKDAQQREQAASRKVDQFLRAAVDAYPDKLKLNEKDGSYALDLVSVSLVSPGKFGGEGDMWAQQRGAYDQANGQSLKMTADLGDGQGAREITVKPRILAFSTPVNSSALESAVLRPFIGGLDVSQQANADSITGLLGSTTPDTPIKGLAGDRLATLDRQIADLKREGNHATELDAHRKRIQGLVAQVRDIMNAPAGSELSWQRAGSEPYKLASRLTALANEVGAVPAFNCKSGKDRTGELDVQVKQLYARQRQDGVWPQPNDTANLVDQQNHVTLVREGGSFQLQKDNTSLPGSKVEVKALVKPLIKAMRAELGEGLSKKEQEKQMPKEAFKGLSAWVGS
jgi:hypothetical protein